MEKNPKQPRRRAPQNRVIPISAIDDYWLAVSDLTIADAAIWMVTRNCPREHERLCEDDDFADYFATVSGGFDLASEYCALLISAVRSGSIKTTREVYQTDTSMDAGATLILKSDWLNWCRLSSYQKLTEFADQFEVVMNVVARLNHGSTNTFSGAEIHPQFLTTSELVECFMGYMGVENPAKVLSEYPMWACKNGASVTKGKRGKPSKTSPDSSQWNPVQFALNLLEKRPLPILSGIGKLKSIDLDIVFRMKLLQPWEQEWKKRKPDR